MLDVGVQTSQALSALKAGVPARRAGPAAERQNGNGWADAKSLSELEEHIRPDDEPLGTGSGYVVDCLHSARLALLEPTYERVVKRAISLGNDTDTTAAVAGGIAGLRHGLGGIPARWLAGLRDRELVDPLAERLLQSLQRATTS